VQALQFHPNGQLLLTAGYDKTLRLFHVDGKKNAKVQSMFLPDLPISSAFFSHDGEQVVATGRRAFFYYYDLQTSQVSRVARIMGTSLGLRRSPLAAATPAERVLAGSLHLGRSEASLERALPSPDGKYIVVLGNDGTAVFVSQATKQWAFNLKINGTLRSASFSHDGSTFYTSSSTSISTSISTRLIIASLAHSRFCVVASWQPMAKCTFGTLVCAVASIATPMTVASRLLPSPCRPMIATKQPGMPQCHLATSTPAPPLNSFVLYLTQCLFGCRQHLRYCFVALIVDACTQKVRPPSRILSTCARLFTYLLGSLSLHRAIMNLTTPVSGLKFNHDSQLLGMYSSEKKNVFKLVCIAAAAAAGCPLTHLLAAATNSCTFPR